MAVFAVTYLYDARDADRDVLRPDHRAFLRRLNEAGALLASGPWTDGDAGALLVVRAEDAQGASALLAQDPFQRAGLVADVTVRGWNPVIGPWT